MQQQEKSDEAQMLLFQFPKQFSLPKVSAGDAKGKSVIREEDDTEIKGHNARKGCTLKELPAGFMGKLLVYRSGAVKLKLGESLFDVCEKYENSICLVHSHCQFL